jgi:hypothetical protein
MRQFRKLTTLVILPALGLSLLAGCETGRTVSQDKTVRTRSDGTVVKQEDKVIRHSDGTTTRTETRKVEKPD